VGGNHDSWWEGIYEVQEQAKGGGGGGGDIERVDWTRIYLTKDQRNKLNVKTSSAAVLIDEGERE